MISNANGRRSIHEKRQQEQRKKRVQQEDMVKHIQNDTLLQATLHSDTRVENKRRIRVLEMHEQDKLTYESIIDDQLRRHQLEQELRLEEEAAQQMEAMHQEQTREQKLRQSIHENSSELRELEKKLNYAYTNKERSLQLEEKKLTETHNKLREASLDSAMKLKSQQQAIEEHNKQLNNIEKSKQYSRALNEQLIELEQKKEQEYEQFLKEKQIVDDVVKKISDENNLETQTRLQKQQETKKYIEEFIHEREQWKRDELQRQQDENAKIQEYARLQQHRDAELANQKKTIEAGKNAIYDKVLYSNKLAAQTNEIQKSKNELEDLRVDLAQEEQVEASRLREQEAMRMRVKKRLEMIEAYQHQVEYKAKKLEREREEKDLYRVQLMKQFAEDDRLEQMNQQKRRMKQMEHKRAVDSLVQERHQLAQSALETIRKEQEASKDMEAYKAKVIEQERQRLLRDHASKLVGFLPKGVLRDKRDLDLFDEEFRAKFGQMGV